MFKTSDMKPVTKPTGIAKPLDFPHETDFIKSSGFPYYTDFTKSSGFLITRSSGIECDTGFPEFIGLVDPVVSKSNGFPRFLIPVVRDLVVSKFDNFRVPMVYPTSDSDSNGFPCVLAAFQTACV